MTTHAPRRSSPDRGASRRMAVATVAAARAAAPASRRRPATVDASRNDASSARILVDAPAAARSYLFIKDKRGKSACARRMRRARWPPLMTNGKPKVVHGGAEARSCSARRQRASRHAGDLRRPSALPVRRRQEGRPDQRRGLDGLRRPLVRDGARTATRSTRADRGPDPRRGAGERPGAGRRRIWWRESAWSATLPPSADSRSRPDHRHPRHIRGAAGGVRERRTPPGGGCACACAILAGRAFPRARPPPLLPASRPPEESPSCLALTLPGRAVASRA